jgi:hypothetical protein
MAIASEIYIPLLRISTKEGLSIKLNCLKESNPAIPPPYVFTSKVRLSKIVWIVKSTNPTDLKLTFSSPVMKFILIGRVFSAFAI